jgi:hypothetical protein
MRKFKISEEQLYMVCYKLLDSKVGTNIEKYPNPEGYSWIDRHDVHFTINGGSYRITHHNYVMSNPKDNSKLLMVPEMLVISMTKLFNIRSVRAMDVIGDWFEDRFELEVPSVELSNKIDRD